MDELLRLNQIEQIRYFKNMTEEQFHLLLEEKDKILGMSIEKFNLLFLNIKNECKKMIIDDPKLFEKLKEVSGIENIEFYIDMAGDWQDSEEATKLERVRAFVTVVLFFGLWILYSKLLIKLCEKK